MGFLNRLRDFLAPLGVLIAFVVLFWTRMGRTLPGGLRPWLVGAAALVLLHLILRGEDVVGVLRTRQTKYGTNTLVLSLAVLAILGGANYLVARHTERFDLTKGQRYSLSDQTRKVLAKLPGEVKITYFQRTRDMAAGQDRLKDYEALSDKLKVDYVDPVKNPAKAQAYDVKGPWPILVVERGEKRERASSDSEEDITNALIKITREGKKTVCVVEGEGERSLDDTSERGLSGAKTALSKSLYEVKTVFLLREKEVPKDCTVTIVAGPEKDLRPEAVAALRDYVKDGGKALVMVEPAFKETYPDLTGLLDEWNIEAGNDVVVDVSGMGQLFGASELAPLVVDYPSHPITKDFRLMTIFGGARSMEAGKKTIEGVTAQDLAKTSPKSWAETDVKLKGAIAFDQGKDTRGPISLAVAATIKGPSPEPSPSPSPSPSAEGDEAEKPKAPEGRVVAVGDVDFATNALLGFQGNEDFFLNTVAWLAQDVDLISIRPHEPEDQSLFLSRQAQQNVTWVALLLLPGIFVVAGVFTWWRRR